MSGSAEIVYATSTTADVFIDMNVGNADGTKLTTAILNSGTIGTFTAWTLNPTSPTNVMTVNHHNISLLGPVIVGATTYPITHTSRSIALNNATNNTYIELDIGSGHHSFSWGGWVTFGPPDLGVSSQIYDYVRQDTIGTGDFNVLQLSNGNGGAGYQIYIETNPDGNTTDGAGITITQGGTYWITMYGNTNTSVCSMSVYNTSGVLVGSESQACYKTLGSPNNEDVQLLKIGNDEIGNDGGTSYFENFIVDYTNAVYPLGPGSSNAITTPVKIHGKVKIRGRVKYR